MLFEVEIQAFDPDIFKNVDVIGKSLFLSLARLMAIFAIIPIFQKTNVPGLVRTGLALALSFITYPAIFDEVKATPDLGHLMMMALLLKETFLGLIIGMVAGIPAWAVEAAGTFIDTQRGASSGSTQSPVSQNETQPVGAFLLFIYVCWLFVSGAFTLLIGVLYDSYLAWPVMSFFPSLEFELTPFFLDLMDRMTRLALLMAGPVMMSMFLGEFSLILVARFAPQLNVFTLAMPVKCGIAFFILIFYMPHLFDAMAEGFGTNLGMIRGIWGMVE